MPNNLDLAALIRCLEVMADENSWDVDKDTYMNTLINPIEARPWDVAKEALAYVNAVRLSIEDRYFPTSHSYIVDPTIKDGNE